MTIEWDIRGWRRLTVRDDPPFVAAREEFLKWLTEVPEPHRTDLHRRLKSRLDHAHFSARLELFIHHYFTAQDWCTQIHPEMPRTGNRPDFLVERDTHQLIVECKTVLDRPPVAQQEQRLRQLATEVGRRLGVTVMLEPLGDLPPGLPATDVRNEINRLLRQGGEIQEVDIRGEHQGSPYGLRAIIFTGTPENELPVGVEGLMSQAQTITIGDQIREALQEKGSKYGELHLPFLISLSVEASFPARTKNEVAALFGSKLWNLHPSGQATETRSPDGLFTMTRNGDPRYSRVSAVLVYRFKWLNNGHEHRLHIYHNPHAKNPIDPGLFRGITQLARTGNEQMGWINSEPDPD